MDTRSLVLASLMLSLGCEAQPLAIDAGASDARVDGAPVDGAPVDDASTDGATSDAGDASAAPDAWTSRTPCWAFDQPSIEELRASPRLVFAHYFSPYPISLDNAAPDVDYYARNYLRPEGESGAFMRGGGLLRERPLGRAPIDGDWRLADMETEVRRAVAIGLDGFTYDVLNPSPSSPHRQRLDTLLRAIPLVDPGFRIQLVLDMTTSSFTGTDDATLAVIRQLLTDVGDDPSLQRLDDGRIVVSMFAGERRDAAFWNAVLDGLEEDGHPVALVPMPVGSWASNRARFDGVELYGASSWGSATAAGATALRDAPTAVHDVGLVWMAPVRPQDSRPKERVYSESSNSEAFRAQWLAAIEGGADWVQLITWNDYSEDSEMAPSSRTQTGFYDLAAYYVTWFKTGVQPVIARDAVFYFHRTHSMDTAVATPSAPPVADYFALRAGPDDQNFVEAVGLLTAPATLQIEIAGHTFEQDVEAGVQSFRVPLEDGTPIVRIVRGGSVVAERESDSPISSTIAYQDPLYHAGSSLTCAE